MADKYTIKTKTAWFTVKDENKLNDILSKVIVIGGDKRLTHKKYTDENNVIHHRLACNGEFCGEYDESIRGYKDIEDVMYKPLQSIIVGAFVLKYVGLETVQYIDAGYTIVTKDNIVYGNIDRVINKVTKDLVRDFEVSFEDIDSVEYKVSSETFRTFGGPKNDN